MSFTALLEGGGSVHASGTLTLLPAGEYRMRYQGTGVLISSLTGEVVPSAHRFDIPWSEQNAALIRSLSRSSGSIPLYVLHDGVAPAPSSDAERVAALPQRTRDFLFGDRGGPAGPEDLPIFLRMAELISSLSDDELAEYRARTTRGTTNARDFDESFRRWLAQLRARQAAETERDTATQALFGLDAVYEMYRSWKTGLVMGAPPSWIATWEGQPVSALPAGADGSLNQLYLRMRRALEPHGYQNLAAFEAAIQRFLVAFRESAYYGGLEMLDRFEHLLVEEQARYQDATASSALFGSLAPARETFREADEQAAAARSLHGSWDPGDVMAYHAAGRENQGLRTRGKQQVAALAATQPLLANPDFPTEDLGRATSAAAAGGVIRQYISSRLGRVQDTRRRLDTDHEIIFRLDVLVTRTRARQGILPGSIWDRIIEDHTAPTVDQVALDTMLGVLALAAGLLSGGSLLAAGVAVGASSYLALQEYRDYAFRSDAYAAQLLTEEPSLTWVVLAVVGAVADVAAVGQVLRTVRPAVQAFQRTGDLVELETRLAGVEARIRQNILAAARQEAQARRGWEAIESVFPQSGMRASIFGADLAAEALARVSYAVYLGIRLGITSFNRWVLTREAVSLIGDINALSPQQVQRLTAVYQTAAAEAQRLAQHGRSVGLSADEIETFLQHWARRGSGTADDVMREMTRRELVIDRTAAGGAVTRSSLPPGYTGGVRIPGPNGTYIQFLPLDESRRARGVVARLDADMVSRATGASASGEVPGRVAAQDRGHLLARILGGPDIPHNLAPLLRRVNQRDMRMVEIAIRNAIREGGEATITVTPRYVAGRVDPESLLVSVRWQDGRHEVHRFSNLTGP